MPPFHHSQIIPELMENAGCELWYLPQYSRLFQPHRGGKKLRLQLEKSYLNTTFMFIEPPMRFFSEVVNTSLLTAVPATHKPSTSQPH